MSIFLHGTAFLFLAMQPEPVSDLIEQLGSKSFEEREAATKKLEGIGVSALPALRAAAKESRDAEVRRRASILVTSLVRRLANRDDLNRMQGRWALIRGDFRGEEKKKDAGRFELVVVDGILRLKTSRGGELLGGFLVLGSADGRKTFDVFAQEPAKTEENRNLLRGIYEINGDTLTLCWATSEEDPRPPKLESTNSPPTYLAVYKRAKD